MRIVLLVCAAVPALGAQALDRAPGPGGPIEVSACDPAVADGLTRRARQALSSPGEKADLLVKAHTACPGRAELLLEAAQILARSHEFDRSLLLADEFLGSVSASVGGMLAVADIQLRAQRFEQASGTASEVLRRDPANATALKLHGNATYFLGRSTEAEAIFLRLLDKYPADAEGAYMLGRIYYQENRLEHAAAQFQKVLRLEPRNYKAYDNLALCHEALGDPEAAIRHFLAAIQIVEKDHPDYDWPYANLASLLLDQGDAQRAYEAAGAAARRNPGSARNFYLGGKALARLGRHEDARKWLERSSLLDRTYSEPVYLLISVYRRLGEEASAAAAAEKFRMLKASEPDERR